MAAFVGAPPGGLAGLLHLPLLFFDVAVEILGRLAVLNERLQDVVDLVAAGPTRRFSDLVVFFASDAWQLPNKLLLLLHGYDYVESQ